MRERSCRRLVGSRLLTASASPFDEPGGDRRAKKTWPEKERIERMRQLAEALTLDMAEPEPVAQGGSSSADRSLRQTKSALPSGQ